MDDAVSTKTIDKRFCKGWGYVRSLSYPPGPPDISPEWHGSSPRLMQMPSSSKGFRELEQRYCSDERQGLISRCGMLSVAREVWLKQHYVLDTPMVHACALAAKVARY